MNPPVRPKAAPRAIVSSDVTRPRVVALAALGAALGAGAVLALTRTTPEASRPSARPHVKADVACAKCHTPPAALDVPAKTFAASGACKSCHADHGSTRTAHKQLAAKGALTCATCHPAHEGAQGVTFLEKGLFVRWGAGHDAPPAPAPAPVKAKTTVPLVSISACATCHDPTRAADPIATCLRPGTADPTKTAALCFDEHRAIGAAGARFVAWDAAREIASTTAWVTAERTERSPWWPLSGALAGSLAVGGAAAAASRRKKTPAASQAASPAGGRATEKRLLPVIESSTCLGCYACVDACPFDVLAIEKYVAVVVRPEECCGVVLCAQICPNGSLTISEGEPIVDRPRTDEHLESREVPGLFLAGDLTGLPLIKNAINQGVRVIDRIAATLPRQRPPLDVVVIGAGPAGLSAALRAKEKNLSCVVLEQATVAASIVSFPRAKLVYDPPLDLPVEGELWLKEATKEELLAQWTRIVRARALDVREDHRVTAIAKDAEAFVVTTSREQFRAARVVVAIGRRGTPRRLEAQIDPGAAAHVHYALADARSFAGKRVLVVGLGDSAMEAAVSIARQPETAVTISYRGATFRRGKARNVAEIEKLVREGKIRILYDTVPTAITRTHVTLDGPRGRRSVQSDAVIALIGGVPSWDLLVSAGIGRPGRKETPPR